MAGEEKTEKATPKRRKDEREKGNVFSSGDLVTAIFLLVVFYSMRFLGKFMLENLMRLITDGIGMTTSITVIDKQALGTLYTNGLEWAVMIAGPILVISSVITILISGAQTGFLFSAKALQPKFSKLNPLSGFKRMFSLRSAVEIVKGLLKLVVIGYVVYGELSERLRALPRLLDMEPLQGAVYLGDAVLSLVTSIGILFILISILDYLYQWWEHEKNLKMSKQEVKEEYKQMEGDPQVKNKIKQRQREMSQKRMMQKVPQADVIIRNPTHYAVAIQYIPEKNNAPVVVAKGADEVARRILKIAEENDVPMTENKPLARALYESVDLDREIPPELYRAVAEVLAVVYDLKKKRAGIS